MVALLVAKYRLIGGGGTLGAEIVLNISGRS